MDDPVRSTKFLEDTEHKIILVLKLYPRTPLILAPSSRELGENIVLFHDPEDSSPGFRDCHAFSLILKGVSSLQKRTIQGSAEVEPLLAVAEQLQILKESGPDALPAYLRNVRLELFDKARNAVVEVDNG